MTIWPITKTETGGYNMLGAALSLIPVPLKQERY